MDTNENNKPRGLQLPRNQIALAVFLVIGGYFLWTEHQAHLLGALPLILILAVCIGMHFFMHGGHGHGPHGGSSDS